MNDVQNYKHTHMSPYLIDLKNNKWQKKKELWFNDFCLHTYMDFASLVEYFFLK